jgi:hypothetical protein
MSSSAAEDQRSPESAALNRHCTDLHAVLDQQRLEPSVDERRQRRLELRRCSRLRLLVFRRPRHCIDEPSFDAGAGAIDGFDVVLERFLLERRIRHGDRLFLAGRYHAHHEVVDRKQDDEGEPHAARHVGLRLLGRVVRVPPFLEPIGHVTAPIRRAGARFQIFRYLVPT